MFSLIVGYLELLSVFFKLIFDLLAYERFTNISTGAGYVVVVVVTLFIQGGPFSYEAGIQRGRDLAS